jgi:putative phosphoesterase
MKLAVVSDSHDNVWKVRRAIPQLQEAEALFHCGDLCSPFMIKEFGGPLPDLPIHMVWGNNEGDRLMISRVAESYPNVYLHGDLAEIDFDGYRVAVNHYPHIATSLAKSGVYDLVCFGHNHQASDEVVGKCLLLNPGELMGLNNPSSFCFVDTETGAIERVTVE